VVFASVVVFDVFVFAEIALHSLLTWLVSAIAFSISVYDEEGVSAIASAFLDLVTN
jgi:hypothetical protein